MALWLEVTWRLYWDSRFYAAISITVSPLIVSRPTRTSNRVKDHTPLPSNILPFHPTLPSNLQISP